MCHQNYLYDRQGNCFIWPLMTYRWHGAVFFITTHHHRASTIHRVRFQLTATILLMRKLLLWSLLHCASLNAHMLSINASILMCSRKIQSLKTDPYIYIYMILHELSYNINMFEASIGLVVKRDDFGELYQRFRNEFHKWL